MTAPSTKVKAAIRRVAREFGIELSRYDVQRSARARRAHVMKRERIDVVFDIGANAGQYGLELRLGGYRGRIVSFEPLAEPFVELERQAAADENWHCLKLALAETSGHATMFKTEASWSSSLLRMHDRYVTVAPGRAAAGTETVETSCLDALAADLLGSSRAPMLKMDVQGYELHVLAGAEATLARVQLVESELALVPIYDGQPSYREVIECLAGFGFDLVGVEPTVVDSSTGHLHEVDGLFARREAHERTVHGS